MKLFVVTGIHLDVNKNTYGPMNWTATAHSEEEAIGMIYKAMREEHPNLEVKSIFARDISGVAHSFVNGGAARIEAEQTQRPTVSKTEFDRMRNALETISDWRLPKTGRYHDSGREMTYGECWGSNGERDYMIKVANEGLGL